MVVIGQEKGHDTTTRIKHNFGAARPEGYRKAVRLMDLAEHFNLPVLSFVDTGGAYPGIGSEERGVAEAIARGTERCLTLGVPMIATITGEGMSGGAIGIAAANRVIILEHSIYAVISPEGCASILLRDRAMAEGAAKAMKITAEDLLALQDRRPHRPRAGRRSPRRPGPGHQPGGRRRGRRTRRPVRPPARRPARTARRTFLRHRPR